MRYSFPIIAPSHCVFISVLFNVYLNEDDKAPTIPTTEDSQSDVHMTLPEVDSENMSTGKIKCLSLIVC